MIWDEWERKMDEWKEKNKPAESGGCADGAEDLVHDNYHYRTPRIYFPVAVRQGLNGG